MEHKVALVTGASRGLGRAISEALLNRGVSVCLADVNEEEGLKTLSELAADHDKSKIEFVACDVSKEDQFKAAMKKCEDSLGKFDLVINNAGIGDEKNWEKTLSVNLGGCILGTVLAMDRMSKSNGGSGGKIVNVSSIAGVKVLPFGPIYAATKSGIVGFSRALGHPLHFSLTGVKVQCICPSMIATPFFKDAMKTPFSEDVLKLASKHAGALEFMPASTVADAVMTLLENGPNGGVMVVEPNKEPYYVESSVPA